VVSTDGARLTLGDPARIPALILQGGRLRILAIGRDVFDHTYQLDAFGWTLIKAKKPEKGVRYKSKSGPITKVLFKVGKRLVVKGKGEELVQRLADEPVVVRAELWIGGRRFCLEFGGEKRTFTPGKKLLRKNASAPGACPTG
jgi:hypothetical protein